MNIKTALWISAALNAGLGTAGSPTTVMAQSRGDTVHYTLSYQGRRSGELRWWVGSDGTVNSFLEYNDRGRGPRTMTVITLDSRGWPTGISIDGHDYRKNPVAFRWSAPTGNRPAAFQIGDLDSWVGMHLLGRAAIAAQAAGESVPLEPNRAIVTASKATTEIVGSGTGETQEVTLLALSWGGSTRARLWVDKSGDLFAVVGWQSLVRAGWESALPALISREADLAARAMAAAADTLLRRPSQYLAITGVNMVDVNLRTVNSGTTILIKDQTILSAGPDGAVRLPAGTEILAGNGRWAMPGLWDMHTHMGSPNDSYGRNRMAIGVLGTRDLLGTLPSVHAIHARRQAVREGREIGPEMVISGFIDGPAENTGPTSVLVATEDSARKVVRNYAAMGYDQIKTYSSLNPALLPVIIDEARQHGLRVSGHIPAFMTAEQAVIAGMSEINHANFLMLNFFGDTIDTRGTDRFYLPMERWPEIDVKSESVQRFIRLVRERGVVLDPTLCIFKAQWGQPGGFPPRNGYTVEHYRQGYRRMEELVMEFYRAGVRLMAGTDNSCQVQDELIIYAGLGIPNWDLIRMATIDAAMLTGRGRTLGSLVAGKQADFILLDGDPTVDIANTKRVSLIIKNGIPLQPAQLRGGANWP